MDKQTPSIVPKKILDFWFAEQHRPLWFAKDADFDKKITKQFLSIYQQAKQKDGLKLGNDLENQLAEVILFDQFPRNMFRGDAQSFEADYLAIAASQKAINLGYDKKMSLEQRQFLYMPFMHSESVTDQRYSVSLFRKLGDDTILDFANKHKEIIVRFGHFPHRNDILGRISTDRELKFLEKNPGF